VGAKSGSRLKKKKTIESFSREKEVISNTREKEEKEVKSKKRKSLYPGKPLHSLL
jgi:hypothetical protein